MGFTVDLIEAFKDTQRSIREDEKLQSATLKMKAGTMLYFSGYKCFMPKIRREKPDVLVTEDTTLHAAKYFAQDGDKKVAVLNFANAYSPGGGVLSGSIDLFHGLESARVVRVGHNPNGDMVVVVVIVRIQLQLEVSDVDRITVGVIISQPWHDGDACIVNETQIATRTRSHIPELDFHELGAQLSPAFGEVMGPVIEVFRERKMVNFIARCGEGVDVRPIAVGIRVAFAANVEVIIVVGLQPSQRPRISHCRDASPGARSEVDSIVLNFPLLGCTELLPTDGGRERPNLFHRHIRRYKAAAGIVQSEVVDHNSITCSACHAEGNMVRSITTVQGIDHLFV